MLTALDLALSTRLCGFFAARGWRVVCCSGLEEAVAIARSMALDAIVLDLPVIAASPVSAMRRLRSGGLRMPIVLLGSPAHPTDRALLLRSGADDCMQKPFDPTELEGRFRVLKRRARDQPVPRCGSLRFERQTGTCYCKGKPLKLSRREASLLVTLMACAEQVVPKERLVEEVFAFDDVAVGAIDLVVHRLRKKLHGIDVTVENVRGIGYLLRPASLVR